jgi:hypothetical protein
MVAGVPKRGRLNRPDLAADAFSFGLIWFDLV